MITTGCPDCQRERYCPKGGNLHLEMIRKFTAYNELTRKYMHDKCTDEQLEKADRQYQRALELFNRHVTGE